MARLIAYTFTSLDGYYADANGGIAWHKHGDEEKEFAADGLRGNNVLVFGRITYAMMASFWPTPMAQERDPVVARGMNNAEKIVFSRTLTRTDWNNTRLVKANMADELRRLKTTSVKDMTILGSGSIVTQCAGEGLIDAYQIMIDPVALGEGRSLFKNLARQLELRLTSTRTFKGSGVVLLCYEPSLKNL